MADAGEPKGAGVAKREEEKHDPDFADILGNGAITKRILSHGKEGTERPQTGNEVEVTVHAVRVDGKAVEDHHSETFCIGDGDVCHALELAVPLMYVGEKAVLVTEPRFDNRDEAEKDSKIEYTLELVAARSPPALGDMTVVERIAQSLRKKERGNVLFGRGVYDDAGRSFNKGMSYLHLTDDDEQGQDPATIKQARDLEVALCNNMVMVYLKCKQPRKAIESCNQVLELSPGNTKAYYRKAKALLELREYNEAKALLLDAVAVVPKEEAEPLKVLQKQVKKLDAAAKMSEKKLYQRMVSALDGTSPDIVAMEEEAAKAKAVDDQEWWDEIKTALIMSAVCVALTLAALWFTRNSA